MLAVIAIIAGACSSSGGSPAASAGASAAAGGSAAAAGSGGAGCTVGVSWNNFQQPRWAAHDKPNIQKTVEAQGGKYIDADANLKSEQQATDIDTMISKGAKVLIVLAQDPKLVLPAVAKAKAAGIPVIGYDRLIEDPSALYITFDNTGVGKAEADAILKKVPTGNYVLIKGDPADPNAKTFLPAGWDQAGLKDKVASGDIKIIGPADGT
jgi:D-xylose transport system substrate-binding protein